MNFDTTFFEQLLRAVQLSASAETPQLENTVATIESFSNTFYIQGFSIGRACLILFAAPFALQNDLHEFDNTNLLKEP